MKLKTIKRIERCAACAWKIIMLVGAAFLSAAAFVQIFESWGVFAR
jgi:hypothetical protein